MYSRGELFMRSREGYFGVYVPSCAATREINTKITLEWAHKQFVTRVHTLFYFLHDMTNPKITLKTRIFTHHARIMPARFTLSWWRHSRLVMTSQWPDQVITRLISILFTAIFTAGRVRKSILFKPWCVNVILGVTFVSQVISSQDTNVWLHSDRLFWLITATINVDSLRPGDAYMR